MAAIVHGERRKLPRMSKRTPDTRRLDVAAACAAGLSLAGDWPLAALDRLVDGELPGSTDAAVTWAAQFEQRPAPGSGPQRWLHVQCAASIRRECQRCLQAVVLPLAIDRSLRFVDDEATAAALDADSEEDVLVASRQFDLEALVEDELLLAMPLVPMHETCPQPLTGPAPEVNEAPRAKPFAALAALKRGPSH
jgi:uncharacterized protein